MIIWLFFSISSMLLGATLGLFIGMGRHDYKTFTTLHAFGYSYFGGLIACFPFILIRVMV